MNEKAPTRDLLKYFDDLHLHHVGVRAVIRPGKDAKLIATFWKSHGETLVRELMADFFESSDPFIRANGYSVGVFMSQASKLIAQRSRMPQRLAPEIDWFDECQRLHGRKCNGREGHRIQMEIDADKAKGGAA